MRGGRDDKKPTLTYSKEAMLHNEINKLLHKYPVDEAKIIALLEIDQDTLKKLLANIIKTLEAKVQPDKRDLATNALRVGTIDGGDMLETVIKLADRKDVVSVLAGLDVEKLEWMKDFVVAEPAVEKILDQVVERKKNAGLHELREAWMRAKTEPLPRKDMGEEVKANKTHSDPGPGKNNK